MNLAEMLSAQDVEVGIFTSVHLPEGVQITHQQPRLEGHASMMWQALESSASASLRPYTQAIVVQKQMLCFDSGILEYTAQIGQQSLSFLVTDLPRSQPGQITLGCREGRAA